MRDCKIAKKALSVLLALSMVSSWVPIPTHAAEADTCTHHTEHTADCGYVAAVAGSPCTHVHDEACGYAEAVTEVLCACVPGEDGVLVHTDGCGYVAPVAAADCTHAHDAACGYIAASEGSPCAYKCLEDHNAFPSGEGGSPEGLTDEVIPETTEAETIPETTEGETVIANQSPDWCGNPLCSQEDAFHVTSCDLYVAPENPQCFCVEKCTEPNVWCDICGFDYTQCGGTDTATVYADCAHTTVTDGICVDCNLYGWCGAPETDDGAVIDKVIWTLTQNNEDAENPTYTLTISGTGEMADYEEEIPAGDVKRTSAPWGVYYDRITKLIVENGVTSIGLGAFDECYLVDVSLPDSLIEIGEFAFYDCYSIESIIIPDSVTTIGRAAFRNCRGLQSIHLPSSLKRMEQGVLCDCHKLKEVIIPNGVEYIGELALNGCLSMTYLEIPASVNNIYEWGLNSIPQLIIRYLGETEPSIQYGYSYYVQAVYVPCTYSGTTFDGNTVTNGHFEAGTGDTEDENGVPYLSYTAQDNVITQKCSVCGDCGTATITVADDLTYDGTNKVSVTYGEGWLGGELDVIEAINADNYTATITHEGATAIKAFTVAKKSLTVTANAQTITYGESIETGVGQISGILATRDQFSEITLTPSTSNVPGGTITPSVVKIVNATGDDVTDNYGITYSDGILTINKSAPVITFNADYTPGKTYDGSAVTIPTVEYITVSAKYDGNVIFTWYEDDVAEDNKLDTVPKDVGTYILVASIAETENNNAATKELTVTISKAPASVTETPTAVSDLIYTGDPQELVSGGKVEGGTLVYSTTEAGMYGATIPTGTNAGNYEIWYKVLGDDNHTDTEPFKLTVEIAQANASDAVVTVNGTYSYTSQAITPDPNMVNVTLNGELLTYDVDYTFTASNNIEVGTYTAIVTVAFKGNYTGTATGKFTIAECPHSAFEDGQCTQCGAACGDVAGHDYDNGICVNGCYQPAELVDNIYQISNAGQLYWFAGLVNGTLTDVAQKKDANAVLTANITMPSNKSWTPIGYNTDNMYAGSFDGQNHTISGLYYNDSTKPYIGLFGYIYDGAVCNVGVLNVDFHGSSCVGGIAGVVGEATVENCYVTGIIDGTDALGGVVGAIATGGYVKNCYGYTNAGNVTGEVNRATTQNCYYLSDSETDTLSGTTAKTAAQFASGEVAYLLQGSQTTAVWGQTIGTDSYPVLGGAKVYQVTDCKGGSNGYSNDPTATGVHNYVNGTCTICGDTIELISVDITWGAMEFTYTDGAWNAETHSYGEGSWSDNGTGWVNVKNSGNVAVTVTYDYDTERTDIAGSFTDGTTAITTTVALSAGEEKKAWLILNGKPSTALNGETIGTVTVTIGR